MSLKNYSLFSLNLALVHSCISLSFVYRDMIANTTKAAGVLQQQHRCLNIKAKFFQADWSRNVCLNAYSFIYPTMQEISE